ncbi:MAG: MFS transporter [Alphaproteobacteria bacterium]|nr:MAG: MFS transporter [Alphaproteobacteria bacterium]
MPHYSDQLSRQSEALPLPITPGGHVLLLWRARSPSPGRQRRHARNFPAGRKRVIPTPEMIPELRKLNGEIRKKIDPGGTNWRRSLCDARPINVSYTNIQIVIALRPESAPCRLCLTHATPLKKAAHAPCKALRPTARHDPSMIEEPSARRAPTGDIDYRLLIPFLAHVTLIQTLSLIIRITTSYRAIELGLPVLWLGIIAAGFAIIPVFTALQVGRWIDRGNDARATWLGSALVFTACIGFWAWPRSAMHLLGFSVLLGFGHMFCMAGHQMLAVRSGGERSRETALGYYMVAASIGQGLGPFVVGWLGGAAALPPTGLLFAISLAVAAASVVVAVLIRPAVAKTAAHDPGNFIPIGRLLALRGFAAVMVSSVVTITALDLLVIYLPALGAERQIESNHIGLLLTVRSVASLVSRVFYARLIFAVGRAPLTLASMLGSAAGFLILALPLPLPIIYAILIYLGFAMGIASTLTLSGVMYLSPPEVCGTALTLRMTGNRVGQIVFPALAGFLAAATGVGGILLALGIGLAASGVAVAMSQPTS